MDTAVVRVDIASTEKSEEGWKVELFFKNGYYWVQSLNKGKAFQRFFSDNQKAWSCYHSKIDEFKLD